MAEFGHFGAKAEVVIEWFTGEVPRIKISQCLGGMMARKNNRFLNFGAAAIPFVGPIAPIWLVLEQVAFYKADNGMLQSSGWLGLAGTLGISFLIGVAVTLARRSPTQVIIAEFSTNLAYLPIYIADELGYFAREGLEVSFTQTYGDRATWHAVVQKDAQFGVADPIAMLDNREGAAGVVVAALVVRSATRAVTRRVMPPVVAAKSLKGLPLRVFGKDTTSYKLLANFLREGAIDPETADIQIMKPHDEASHLLDSGNPVVFTFDPAAAAAVQGGAREVFNGSTVYGEFLNTGVFVRHDYAATNPQTVQNFVTALEGAMCFMQENRGFTIEFAARKFTEASFNSIMAGVARLFVDGVYAKHVTLHTNLWSRAVAKRFGEAELSKFQFSSHVNSSFADNAKNTIRLRRDWTGFKANIAGVIRSRR